MRRRFVGSAIGIVSTVAIGGALLPLRSHIGISTAALVLVVPVVFGAVVGGFFAGSVSVIAGFLVYDFEFIPPYRTLSVGAPQNWTALGVYAVVMLLIAQVVARLDSARSEAQRANDVMRQLWRLSELLVGDQLRVDRTSISYGAGGAGGERSCLKAVVDAWCEAFEVR
jgi:two-component system sensor histidine kinase KdpD